MPPRPPAPLTVVVGTEELLVARAVASVTQAARAVDPDVERHDLEATSLAPGDLAAMASPSLFGGAKVVVLRAVQDAGKEIAAEITSYAQAPEPDVALVAVHAGAAKGKALLTALLGAGAQRLEAAALTKPGQRRDFLRAEFKSAGRPVVEEALTALLEAVGSDLRELSAACSQLLSDHEGTVDLAAVQRYHRGRADASGFAIADRAVEGDAAGALELLRWGQGTGLAPVLVTSALAGTLRTVAQVASAGRGVPSHQLAGQLGMPPWKVDKSLRQARGWRPEGLAAAVRAVALADAEVKGAAADQAYAVEKAVLAVVRARAGG